ncbi:MAG TPA: hypothetical protein VFE25_06195 [Opitutaceae bacterium]|jgi:hypothetical protein|nr:hypothetical protein [Opitutaceae bacterium]
MRGSPAILPLLEARSLRVASACALIFVAAAAFESAWLPIAYRFAVFACLAPCVGSVLISLIHRTTGGQWTEGIERFLGAGVRLLPWVWLLLLPLALFPSFPSHPAPVNHGAWLGYDGRLGIMIRFVATWAVFMVIRHWLRDGAGRTSDPRLNTRPWVGPAGLVLTFLTSTFVADDWLESLEPGWHSTAFPVVWMASQVVSALALALILGIACGLQPDRRGGAGRTVGIDWGNLLLATLMFWAYVTFCEFLIIWAGNLPAETSWYLRRTSGDWRWVIGLVALLGIAVPFFMLLSRRVKSRVPSLALGAVLVLGGQWLYLLWVIVPAHGSPGLGADLAIIGVVGTAAALFAVGYIRIARMTGVAP